MFERERERERETERQREREKVRVCNIVDLGVWSLAVFYFSSFPSCKKNSSKTKRKFFLNKFAILKLHSFSIIYYKQVAMHLYCKRKYFYGVILSIN